MIVAILFTVVTIAGVGLNLRKPRAPKPPRYLDSVADLEVYLERVVKTQHPPGRSRWERVTRYVKKGSVNSGIS
jgi:hypothetical protein